LYIVNLQTKQLLDKMNAAKAVTGCLAILFWGPQTVIEGSSFDALEIYFLVKIGLLQTLFPGRSKRGDCSRSAWSSTCECSQPSERPGENRTRSCTTLPTRRTTLRCSVRVRTTSLPWRPRAVLAGDFLSCDPSVLLLCIISQAATGIDPVTFSIHHLLNLSHAFSGP
jgi:hypothetical protein